MQSLAVDVHRAKRLAKAGQELMAEYSFTKDVLESKCLELKSLCKKLEIMFTKKRQSLLKFLELFQTLESISKVPIYLFKVWCHDFESIIGSFLFQVNNQASLFLSDKISEDVAEVSLTELRKLEYVLKQVDHW